MILDTGSTKYMSGLLNHVTTLTKVKDCYVTLGDSIIKLHVTGNDTIRIYMESHVVEQQHVLYVFDLEYTLLSVTEHIQSPNYSLKSEKTGTHYIIQHLVSTLN